MQAPTYLVNEHYDDRYFDVVNAIEEAKQIFFEGTGIIDMLTKNVRLSIGETGFGAGRLLIALMDYLDNSGMTDLAITYNSVELHPLSAERMSSILEGFRDRKSVV
jgi:tRNA U34 5-methylaminomethyl-2-thiouridine-forming methyltransferase MnmC